MAKIEPFEDLLDTLDDENDDIEGFYTIQIFFKSPKYEFYLHFILCKNCKNSKENYCQRIVAILR